MIGITLILLYINTDMFKSEATLFTKYLGQNVENMDAIYREIGNDSEYDELLKQNKHTTETQIKVNTTEGIGTTAENTQNSINSLKLQINGQVDPSNQYNYQDIQLFNNNEKVTEVEYIQDGSIAGIRFSDIFKEYLLTENEDLKELLKRADYTEEELASIPEALDFENDLKNTFQFSEEEKQSIKIKYINLINSNVSKNNFSKQKNQTIQINGKSINVNAYALTLTKEQINNIYIKILEEVKQDEIILSKIDNVQTLLDKYLPNRSSDWDDLREQFVDKLEEIIKEITRNNIGQEEAKIVVYENYHNTVRTVIQNPEFEITIDLLSLQAEDYVQIEMQDITNKKGQVLTYKKQNEKTNISYQNIENQNTTEYSLLKEEKTNGNNCTKNWVAKYQDASNRVEATIEQNIDMVSSFEPKVLEEETVINLSELEKEELQSILEQVNSAVSKRVNEITTNNVKVEDLWKVLKIIGLVKEGETLESMGITETQKNRFNSKFEILQGENLGNVEIQNLIDAIKDNFIEIEVVSNTELKLKLDQLNNNEELVTTMKSFIEENKFRKYNAKVEYNKDTNLVSAIVLTMLEK